MDPPYSAVTHEGQRSESSTNKSTITYPPITRTEVCVAADFVAGLNPRTVLVFGDHVTAQWWRDALSECGLYVFAPVPWVKPDPTPRFSGDGPTSSAEYITVARRMGAWSTELGHLPGHYVFPKALGQSKDGDGLTGQKPRGLIEALLRDYTRQGDMVVDLYAGRATTLDAARRLGRHSLGVECNKRTLAAAVRRLEQPWQPDMFEAQQQERAQLGLPANDDEERAAGADAAEVADGV